MVGFFSATFVIIVFFVSAFGWGRLATKLFYRRSTGSLTYDAVLGLTVLVFIGGMLNVLGVVNALALDLLVISGIILWFALLFWQHYRSKRSGQKLAGKAFASAGKIRSLAFAKETAPVLLVILATAFLIRTTLPSQIFNYHDDFYKYFPRLFRMLQSGEIGGTPFDSIGIDSLGAHAFLQSFILAHFPLEFINGFDVVFCFLLGGLLLNDIGRKSGVYWLVRIAAIGAFITINPQYVNISALYSGSLLVLSLFYSALLFFEHLKQGEARENILAAIPFALLTATLLGLKNTFVLFALVNYGVFWALLILFAESRKVIWQATGAATAAAAIFLLPWILSVYDKIFIFYDMVAKKASPELLSQEYADLSSSVWGKLFSLQKLLYGGLAIDYSITVLTVFVFAAGAVFLLIKKSQRTETGYLVLVISAGAATTLTYLVNAYIAREFDVGIRYICPIIIAVLPVLALMFNSISDRQPSLPEKTTMELRHIAGLLVLGMVIGLFLNNWLWRVKQLSEYRVLLSFPVDRRYVSHMRNSLSEAEKETVQSMQMRTAEKTTILAWFDTPFHLDFNRNKVFTVGVASMLMDNTESADVKKLGAYLKSLGVRYIIWQYNGLPKQMSRANNWLEEGLRHIWEKARPIYDDGRRVVLDLNNF